MTRKTVQGESEQIDRFMDIDADHDGLSNEQERQAGTDPMAADSDGDGLNDGSEINTHRTNPLVADTDDRSMVWRSKAGKSLLRKITVTLVVT